MRSEWLVAEQPREAGDGGVGWGGGEGCISLNAINWEGMGKRRHAKFAEVHISVGRDDCQGVHKSQARRFITLVWGRGQISKTLPHNLCAGPEIGPGGSLPGLSCCWWCVPAHKRRSDQNCSNIKRVAGFRGGWVIKKGGEVKLSFGPLPAYFSARHQQSEQLAERRHPADGAGRRVIAPARYAWCPLTPSTARQQLKISQFPGLVLISSLPVFELHSRGCLRNFTHYLGFKTLGIGC